MCATTYSPYQHCPGLWPVEGTHASTHIKTINVGKLGLSIQRIQKHGYQGYIREYDSQLVCRACG